MDLHRQDVGTIDQKGGIDRGREELRFRRSAHGRRRHGAEADRPAGHVAAEHLGAVQIDHGAVVAHHLQADACEARGVGNREALAEIGGDVLAVCIRAVADHRGFVAVTVSELSRAGGPRGVVGENRGGPGTALVRPVVEVPPDTAGGDERRGRCDGCGARERQPGKGESNEQPRLHLVSLLCWLRARCEALRSGARPRFQVV